MRTFNFNGLNSYDNFKVLITKMPDIILPKRRIEGTPVPGRDGCIYYDEETYEPFTLPIECAIQETTEANLLTKINQIKVWLKGCEGDLIFSNQPGVSYTAKVINRVDFVNTITQLGQFIILFECQPFAKFTSNSVITLNSSGAVVNNTGTYKSKPIIKVYGTGTINLTIGTQQITLNNVSSYVTVDSVLVDCYKDTVLKNNDMVGEFPVLEVGNNTVSWTGTVTKVEITPNFNNL